MCMNVCTWLRNIGGKSTRSRMYDTRGEVPCSFLQARRGNFSGDMVVGRK